MGIKNLMVLIKKICPSSIKEIDTSTISSRILSCDASITMYQFLFSTLYLTKKNEITQPQDPSGTSSGHIMGMIYRSLFFLEHKIQPIWVFDGKPPNEKTDILFERMSKISESEELMADSIEKNDFQSAFKYKVQSLRLTDEMKNDAKRVIGYLGLPCVVSPGEAEAQCAYLSNLTQVYGTLSEDSDCLAFGAKKLIKGLTGSEKSKKKLVEISLEDVLKGLGLDMTSFVDLCILCGTDYNENIKYIGAVNAYKHIQKYGNIENIIKEVIEKQKNTAKRQFVLPKELDYNKIRGLFRNPEVNKIGFGEIEWKKPDVEGLVKYLIEEKAFSPNRTSNIVKRLNAIK